MVFCTSRCCCCFCPEGAYHLTRPSSVSVSFGDVIRVLQLKIALLNDEGLAEAQGEMQYSENVYRR